MLRIYGDSDDTLIVEHTGRTPTRVLKGFRHDGTDLVQQDYVLYDDNLFDVSVAVYEITDAVTDDTATLTTTWGERDMGDGYQRYYELDVPEGNTNEWVTATVSVPSERNPRNAFTELHV